MVRDYDEHFPIARNWADGLAPYLGVSARTGRPRAEKSFQLLFRCPTSGAFYVYNDFYSTISASQDKNSAASPLLYEAVTGARNASDKGQSWPRIPIHRVIKNRGNNVLFGDGHVEVRQNKPVFRPFAPLPRPTATPTPKPPKSKPAPTAKP